MNTFARRARIALVAVAVALSSSLVATPASGAAQSFTSDDFSTGVLGAAWTVVDPVGDGEVSFVDTGTADARLALSVPAGTDHDPWGSNRALRVMQPAADVDFEAEARWTTVPSKKFQSQGLIVQQDADNWMRFDVHHTGSVLRLFVSRTVAGQSTALLTRTVAPGAEVGLRVQRSGSAWTVDYSGGGSWTEIATVQHSLAVASVGPFAGNSGPKPAFVSEVDYVMDLAAPIAAEDGTPAPTVALSTDVVGQGAVLRSPDATDYPLGSQVALTAQPADGWQFSGWSGDASGNDPQTTVSMSAARAVTATFEEVVTEEPEPDTFPLAVSVVGQGVVGRSPSGTTFDAGTVVELTATPEEGWTFAGWSGDVTGTQPVLTVTMSAARTVTATFEEDVVEPPTGPAVLTSDDFSAGLLDEDLWTVVDPVGDGQVSVVGGGTDDVRLALSVPAGVSHDAFNANRSLRVVQDVADGDFEVAARFTSSPDQQYQQQGLLVEQDASNWMRFDIHSTGTGWRLYAGRTVNGKTTKLLQKGVPMAPEVTLRLGRSGDVWDLDYSLDDGLTWVGGGEVTHALDVSAVGPFAGNSGLRPAFTAEVDWFFDTTAPVDPEDGQVVVTYPLTVQTQGEGTVSRSPSAVAYPAGTQVSLTAVPASGWELSGWSGAASGTEPSVTVSMSQARTVTATFTEVPPQPPSPPVIDVWYGDDQTFGEVGTPQRWVNVLGNVTDADGVASLTYSLNGAPAVPLSMGPNLRRLFMPGDFNVQLVEADLPVGASTVLLRAVDTEGDVATRTVTVRKAPAAATLPLEVDWSTTSGPNDRTQVVDGKWATGQDGLTVLEMGYDRTVGVGDSTWTDYEATVPVTVRGLGPGAGTPQSGAPLIGLGVHWDGHTPRGGENPAVDWYPTGAFAWYEFYGSGRFTLQGNQGWPLVRRSMVWDFGTTYVMKVRAEAETGGIRYSYKWWPQGTAEPATWTLSVVEDDGPQAGSLLLIAHHVDATFGTVRIDPL
ncbi:hypothetical protein [Jannaschia sp. R86511]|uniref:InlB B-repeat-containing protein n=1 Tax=Jannaschia sp. R86511 TaxID=3093853 RepID=UPI0036D4103B